MSKREKAEIRFVRLVMLLLALTLTCFWMLGNLYARYAVQESGSDWARVAGFQVQVAKEEDTATGIGINKEDGDLTADNVSFTVTGSSEAAFGYSLQVELERADGAELTRDEWAKIKPQITPDSEEPVTGTPETLTDEENASCTYTFDKKETVAPQENYSKRYTLDFGGTLPVNFAEGFLVNIYVDGQQID